ncbi:MAG: SemiSWEET transporter [Pseudomonadota bacterium]|nr:MAG: SemiSWEET transporter [Pseudomonadota bacterium]
MNSVTLLGLTAAACTTAAFVPQVMHSLRTRDTRGLSLGMYAVFTVGIALWLVYGLILGDWPIILANGITLALCAMVLMLKCRHG